MIAYIGRDYWLDNETLVHCIDVYLLRRVACVGVYDANEMIWKTKWVSFERLSKHD